MADNDTLLPPISVISERLTRNQRERHLLRALFKLAVRAEKERTDKPSRVPGQEADGRGVGACA
jgi:hypothetical protein